MSHHHYQTEASRYGIPRSPQAVLQDQYRTQVRWNAGLGDVDVQAQTSPHYHFQEIASNPSSGYYYGQAPGSAEYYPNYQQQTLNQNHIANMEEEHDVPLQETDDYDNDDSEDEIPPICECTECGKPLVNGLWRSNDPDALKNWTALMMIVHDCKPEATNTSSTGSAQTQPQLEESHDGKRYPVSRQMYKDARNQRHSNLREMIRDRHTLNHPDGFDCLCGYSCSGIRDMEYYFKYWKDHRRECQRIPKEDMGMKY